MSSSPVEAEGVWLSDPGELSFTSGIGLAGGWHEGITLETNGGTYGFKRAEEDCVPYGFSSHVDKRGFGGSGPLAQVMLVSAFTLEIGAGVAFGPESFGTDGTAG